MKKVWRIGEKILYALLAFLGMALIINSKLFTDFIEKIVLKIFNECISSSNVQSIISDIGVGLFPTGTIGFIISLMQTRTEKQRYVERRSSILRSLNFYVRDVINHVCNLYLSTTLDKPVIVWDAFNKIESMVSTKIVQTMSTEIPHFDQNEKSKLNCLLDAIEEIVKFCRESIENDYLSEDEAELISELGKTIHEYFQSTDLRMQTERYLRILKILNRVINSILELKLYLNWKYNGVNISKK